MRETERRTVGPRQAEQLMDVLSAVAADRVVTVIRASRVTDPVGLADALTEAGIRCVEFTFTIPGAAEVIREAASSSAVVGAGTVLTADQVRAAVASGARFLVTPVLRPEVTAAAGEVPVFVGALTPTEILAAVDMGATAVKVFPASIGGPEYIRDLRGPFPDLVLVPSGGIGEENARLYLEAGAAAVYAGSSLAPAALVEAGDHAGIQARAKSFVESLG